MITVGEILVILLCLFTVVGIIAFGVWMPRPRYPLPPPPTVPFQGKAKDGKPASRF